METYPKRVIVLDYQPRANLVMGTVEFANELGALAEATGILARLGINLRMAYANDLPDGRAATLSFIGTAPSKLNLWRIESALLASPKVKNCKMMKSDRGLISDVLHFPTWIADGQPVVLVTPNSLNSMFSHVKKLLGTGGEAMLYEEGLAVGRRAAETFTGFIPIRQLRELGPYVCGIYSALGWGRMTIRRRAKDGSRISLAIRDNFETIGVTSGKPNCQFVRGAVAGYLSGIFGRSYACSETKCAATGELACVFTLS